jgi:hypothetical protein
MEKTLCGAGFSRIEWVMPIVSKEGIAAHGQQFWNSYLANCDVAYFLAHK